MNRIILSFTILGLLLIYSAYSESYLMDYCEETLTTLETCAEQIKKEVYPQAEITADKLLADLEKRNTLLRVIRGDSDVSKVYGKIVAVSCYIDDAIYDECIVAIRECQGNVRELKEQNRTGFGNVL